VGHFATEGRVTVLLWWLAHAAGLDNAAGYPYLLWSGIGADLSEITLLGGAIAWYVHRKCHVEGCWRLGRFPVEGTPFTVCRRHTPGGAPSHAHVLHLHRRARAERDAALASRTVTTTTGGTTA
jgi:hypothetical protein